MPLDRRAQRLLDMLGATRGGALAPETPQGRRAALEALAHMADTADCPEVDAQDRRLRGAEGPIGARVYAPANAPPVLPGLMFFHGGGWVAGSLSTHDGLCRRLCAASGARVIAVDYRLAPEHRFPAALMDCLAATRGVAEAAASLGVDPTRIAVAGDSVGGGLAAAVARMAGGDGGLRIALQLLICPILDVDRQGGTRETFGEDHFISRAAFAQDLADYLPPATSLADPRVSPLRAESLAATPPAIVHTAEFDPFRDEGEAYAERLRRAGVPTAAMRHPGMIHYFYAMARAIPYAAEAAAMMGAQVRTAFGTAGGSDAEAPRA